MAVLPREAAPRKARCRAAVWGATLVLGALLAGCATPPPASDPQAVADYHETNDPLEPTNRVLYSVNNGLDTAILRPVAVGYRDAVPQVVRTHTHDFLVNLSNPVTLADDMLQGKPRARRRHADAAADQHHGGCRRHLRRGRGLGLSAARHRFRRHPGAVGPAGRTLPVPAAVRPVPTRATRWASAAITRSTRSPISGKAQRSTSCTGRGSPSPRSTRAPRISTTSTRSRRPRSTRTRRSAACTGSTAPRRSSRPATTTAPPRRPGIRSRHPRRPPAPPRRRPASIGTSPAVK